MEEKEAERVVRQALFAVIGHDPADIDLEDNLLAIGILDSIDSMKLLFEIDKTVGEKVIQDHELGLETFKFSYLVKAVNQVLKR